VTSRGSISAAIQRGFRQGRRQLSPKSLLVVAASVLALAAGVRWASSNILAADLQSRPQYAQVDGTVEDATSKQALAGIRITAAASAGTWAHSAITDAAGHFLISDLPFGACQITASGDGHFPGAYGQVWPLGPSRLLDVTMNRHSVRLYLWRPASLSGQLTDGQGHGIAQTRVRMWPVPSVTILETHGTAKQEALTTTTDQSGAFAYANIRPGRYYLAAIQSYASGCDSAATVSTTKGAPCANPLSATQLTETHQGSPARETSDRVEMTFYPGVESVDEAEQILLSPGEMRAEVTIAVRPVHLTKLTGVVSGPMGPQSDVTISLVRAANTGWAIPDDLRAISTMSDSSGRFGIPGIASGSYSLFATYFPRIGTTTPPTLVTDADGRSVVHGVVAGIAAPTGSNPVFQARVPVNITGDRDVIVDVLLQRAAEVRGVVEIREQTLPVVDRPSLKGARVTLEPLTNRSMSVGFVRPLNPAGQFEIGSVPEAIYKLTLSASAGFAVSAITTNGTTYRDGLLRVECCGPVSAIVGLSRITSTTGVVGSVQTPDGRPDVESVVLVFPSRIPGRNEISISNQYRLLTPHGDGMIAADNLPDGRYRVVALRQPVFPFDWRDPDILHALIGRATEVTVANGRADAVKLVSVDAPRIF
jgi:Carboxypeptidase regulatory-like domain